MPTIYDNRKAHLLGLIGANNGPNGRGGATVVARRANVAAATLSQIALGLEVQAAAGEKRRPGKIHQMGDSVARKIEQAFGMSEGAMDRPQASPATQITSAQRDLLVTIEAMLLSGCMSDEECAAERGRLVRTYPVSAEGFGVHVLYAGDHALIAARPSVN